MNAPFPTPDAIAIPQEFSACFAAQRAAYFANPEPSYAERLNDLKSLARLLKENRDELVMIFSENRSPLFRIVL